MFKMYEISQFAGFLYLTALSLSLIHIYVDGLYTILKNCSLVYTHYTDDPVSMEKIRQYEEKIRMMGMDEILEQTIRRKVVRKNRQSTEEKREGTADG